MKTRRLSLGIFLIMWLLSASCTAPGAYEPIGLPADVSVGAAMQTGDPEVLTVETVPVTVCNCGDTFAPITYRAEKSHTVTNAVQWEFGGNIGVGVVVPLGVASVDISPELKAAYGNQFAVSRTETVGFDLPANSGTHMGYVIQWREVWQPGRINVRSLSTGNTEIKYKYLLRIEGSLVENGGQNIGCATSCEQGESTFRAAHIPTRIPLFSVTNQLVQPIEVWANGEFVSRIAPQSTSDLVLRSSPASVSWFNVRDKISNTGQEVGEVLSETWPNVEYGANMIVDNQIGSQWYFYPIVTNQRDFQCFFAVNDGWPNEVDQHIFITPSASRVGLGYYKLYSDSNVTFYCNAADSAEYTWFGLRPDLSGGKSFAQQVDANTGIIEFTLQP